MTVIHAKRFKGVMEGHDTETGEPGVTVLAVEVEDGSDVYVRMRGETAYESIVALMPALGRAARTMTEMMVLIPAQGWQIELPPGPEPQPILHVYLPGQEARLSFRVDPTHLRPLAERLAHMADVLEQRPPDLLAPGTQTRN
ncbi:hypothetical protein [Methylobacterium oryzihabitans]|uniref:Uncharacterized protein n=1 Tax=Methylobacterium oryzihabitans TaxID=2499852 RepID=A0A3S2V4A0_9HYPH|nr:hypothetical protein [Methylobacterium oryzihabitans]RVU15215.1 hypothetical protein EOE48_20625 [Methylobacterium oryzihabitans]